MNYILVHEHESGVTTHPFTSKSKTVLAKHDPEEIAKILGVEYSDESGSERVTVGIIEARPLDFDAMLAAMPTKPAE